jgi:hypothetical protein
MSGAWMYTDAGRQLQRHGDRTSYIAASLFQRSEAA